MKSRYLKQHEVDYLASKLAGLVHASTTVKHAQEIATQLCINEFEFEPSSLLQGALIDSANKLIGAQQ